MDARAALIVVAALGCGCGMGDDTADGGRSDMVAGASPSDIGMGCALVTISHSSIYPPATLTATTNASGHKPTWTVQRAGDSNTETPQSLDDSGLTVQYVASLPGTYVFYVSFAAGGPCSGFESFTLNNPKGRLTEYRLRALPPETAGLPLTDKYWVVVGGTPQSGVDIVLDSGALVSGSLVSSLTNKGVAGEVRLVAADLETGPDAVTRVGDNGAFGNLAVSPMGHYRPLLIPDSTALAPALLAAQSGAQIAASARAAPFVVTPGEPVAGSVRDDANHGIASARVVLRAEALPSGVGVTSDSGGVGAYTLRAQAASYTLSVGSTEWPEVTATGVVVPTGGVTLDVAFTVARAAVAGIVRGSDGKAVAGARVTIRSGARALGSIAIVTVGNQRLDGQGRVSRVVTTGADGSLPSLALPAGSYDITVEPPAGTRDGLTAFTAAAPGSWTLALRPPITLSGRIVRAADGRPVTNARVTALAQLGLGAAPSALTDSNGAYALTVDAGTPSQLSVEPAAGDHLAGVRVNVAAGANHADVALDSGLALGGVVRAPGGAPLPAVRVEARLWQSAEPTPLATTITNGTGAYLLYLPDPGDAVADMGATD
jgi:hypothetical protein